MVNLTSRTKWLRMRLNEEEYAQVERAAQLGFQSVGKWCRGVILANANGQSSRTQQSGGAEALMAELVALRTILLNKQVNGESLTAEYMQRLIERADADKLKKAAERLQQDGKSSPS